MSEIVQLPIKDIYTIGTDIWDRYHKWKEIIKDESVQLNLLYLECKYNLSILDSIGLKNNQKFENYNYYEFIFNLQTEMLETFIFNGTTNLKSKIKKDSKKETLINKLIEKIHFNENEEDNDYINNQELKKEISVLEAIIFIYAKVNALKKLANIDEKNTIKNTLKFDVRLKNIKSNFETIVSSLKKDFKNYYGEKE